jgi:hypothetical protein
MGIPVVNIPDPENIQHGELNPGYNRSPRPDINKSEIDRRIKSEYRQPDVTKEISGPRIAIAVEAGRMEYAGDVLVGNAAGKFQNAQQVMVVKARLVEGHRINHPVEGGLKYADETTEVNPKDLHVLLDDFVAEDETITDTPQPGDYIMVDFENRLYMTGPKYLGLKYRGSKNAGAKNAKTSSQAPQNNTSLQNTTAPPGGNGSPVPATPVGNPPGPPVVDANGRPDCRQYRTLNSTPGLQPVTSGGPARPTDQYEQLEMVIIDGTASMLFPKKYIRAVQALRKAFKEENGYEIGVNSAYRRVDLQRCMFQRYNFDKAELQRQGRNAEAQRLAPTGDPDALGRSPLSPVHIAGRAVDFNTGYDPTAPKDKKVNRNSEFTEYFIENKQSLRGDRQGFKDNTLDRTMAGEFGPTAQWMVKNSERFGFRWSGWGFQELWHYDFDVNLGKQLGYVDE